jgi:hypothetical protein
LKGPARVLLACALLPAFISVNHADRRQLEATTAGDSANDSALLFSQALPPAFRTAVNLVIMDAQVVSAQGTAVPDLTTAQFAISIAGHERHVVLAEFVHNDEGPINRSPIPARRDAASLAACVFGFARSDEGTNAHYLLGVEPSDSDKSGIKQPKVKVNDKALVVRRWAWRSGIAAPAAR